MAVLKTKRGRRLKVVEAGALPPDPPFSPGKLSAVINWYDLTDASSLTIVSGAVNVLTDKKGNRNLSSKVTNYPTYSASGGGNNNAFLTIDTAHDIYNSTSNWPGVGNGAVGFAVIRFKSFTPTENGVGSGDYRKCIIGYNGRESGLIIDQDFAGYAPYLRSSTGSNYSTQYSNFATTQWQVITFRSTAITRAFPNDQPNGQTCKTDFAYMSPLTLRLGYFALSAEYELSELIFADTTLTDNDEANIRNYLMDKYTPTIQPYFLTFGDSLTANSCGTADQWPALVSTELGLQLVNYGWGGTIVQPNGSATGVAGRNLSDVYLQANVANKASWIHVGFGVNDTNQSGIDATWKTLYNAKIQSWIDAGYDPDKIVIVKQPSTTIRQATMASAFSYITAIASEMGIRLYDANQYFISYAAAHSEANQDYLFGDTLHPNAEGSLAYAEGLLIAMSP